MNDTELYNKIAAAYNQTVKTDPQIKALMARVSKQTATQADISRLADRLGAAAKDAFVKYLTPENLPDNKLYFRVAERTIRPVMDNVSGRINGAAMKQLAAQDTKAGLKISMTGSGDASIKGLVNNLVTASENGTLESALGTEVETAARRIYDDFQQANEDLRYKLGYECFVRREYDDVGLHDGKDVCKWCMQRVGVFKYPYDAEEADVWRRHPGCKCRISFTTAEGTEMIKNFNKRDNSAQAYERKRKAAYNEYLAKAQYADAETKSELWHEYENKRDSYADKYHQKKKKKITTQYDLWAD